MSELNFPVNLTKEIEHKVSSEDTAAAYGSGLIEVFATPAMIALMENAAQLSVDKFLAEGQSTVGIEINVKHVKASPVGMRIKCKSVLTKVDGKRLYFDITAEDEKGVIGTAEHIRYVIDIEKFMQKLSE